MDCGEIHMCTVARRKQEKELCISSQILFTLHHLYKAVLQCS